MTKTFNYLVKKEKDNTKTIFSKQNLYDMCIE